MATSEIAEAKKYTPEPYWGCPNCGSNTWGAVDPFATEMVYRCHGYSHNGLNMTGGCGTLFMLSQQAKDEHRQELIDAGYRVIDEEKTP